MSCSPPSHACPRMNSANPSTSSSLRSWCAAAALHPTQSIPSSTPSFRTLPISRSSRAHGNDSPEDRKDAGGAVPGHCRDAAQATRLPLHGGAAHRSGDRLLAAGRPTRVEAVGDGRGDRAALESPGVARKPTAVCRARPQGARPAYRPDLTPDRLQGNGCTRNGADAHPRAEPLRATRRDDATLPCPLWTVGVPSCQRAGRKGLEYAEEAPKFAEGESSEIPRMVADRTLGIALVGLGEPALARRHLEDGNRLYDAERHRDLALVYGMDFFEVNLAYLALTDWFLGFPDRALRANEETNRFSPGPYRMRTAFVMLCVRGPGRCTPSIASSPRRRLSAKN